MKHIDWKKVPEAIMWRIYYYIIVPILVFRLSHKKKIKVLFYLVELSSWKTELLFKAMSENEIIEPIIGITDYYDTQRNKTQILTYCKEKGYRYIFLDRDLSIRYQVKADILLYQKPYIWEICRKHRPLYNMQSLFIDIPYGFHSLNESWNNNQYLHRFCWMRIFENYLLADNLSKGMRNKGCNIYVTGTPVMDKILNSKDEKNDVWKADLRKKIIWAPHHTIGDIHLPGIAFSNFIDMADDMLLLVDKYKESVQFAFKPHPRLYRNLVDVWGKEKTDAYYAGWSNRENCMLCDGQYDDLFAYSDAMIHDCCSFIVEYLYTNKPVAYIVRKENTMDNMPYFINECLNQHVFVNDIDEIEWFIQNVINGIDTKKQEREQFVAKYLLPPNGNSACDNIISAILDKNERQKFKLSHSH